MRKSVRKSEREKYNGREREKEREEPIKHSECEKVRKREGEINKRQIDR